MKRILNIAYTIVLIILLSYQPFATDWYCDGALTGTDNGGTSWADAWESFAEINWASISAGDTLFISGGADSLIYYETLGLSDIDGTSANRITIIAGKYSPSPSGHSGRVIIDGGLTRDQSINILASSYVTVKGLECRYATQGVQVEGDPWSDNVILDSLNIYEFLGHAGIFVNGYQDTLKLAIV